MVATCKQATHTRCDHKSKKGYCGRCAWYLCTKIYQRIQLDDYIAPARALKKPASTVGACSSMYPRTSLEIVDIASERRSSRSQGTRSLERDRTTRKSAWVIPKRLNGGGCSERDGDTLKRGLLGRRRTATHTPYCAGCSRGAWCDDQVLTLPKEVFQSTAFF